MNVGKIPTACRVPSSIFFTFATTISLENYTIFIFNF